MTVTMKFKGEVTMSGETLAEIIQKLENMSILSATALDYGASAVTTDYIDTDTQEVIPDNTKMMLYQPRIYQDDGINIGWICPEELDEDDYFATREDAEVWCENFEYDLKDISINEEEIDLEDAGNDIGYHLLDCDGNGITDEF